MLGLSAGGRQHAHLRHQRLGLRAQHRVLRHRHHVLKTLALQIREHLGGGKATIEAHAHPRRREGLAQSRHETLEQPDGPEAGGGVAGAQQIREQVLLGLLIELREGRDRQVAPGVVVPVEEGELLRAVRRVVGRIELQRDALDTRTQPAAMARDHGVGERASHAHQGLGPKGILKARERRLRGQRLAADRIALEQQLVHRIGTETGGIVAVLVAAGDRKDALAHQILKRVNDFARLARIGNARRDRARQAETLITGFEQQRTAIGAAVGLVELRDNLLAQEIVENNSLSCGIVWHWKVLDVLKTPCRNDFLAQMGPSFFLNSRIIRVRKCGIKSYVQQTGASV